MIEIDHDRLDADFLHLDAFEVAVDCATNAHVAGLEPALQLEHGIKGYILALNKLGYSIVKDL